MRINANMSALNTHRQLSANQASTSRSVERLSSGLRINRAGDDAAGLAISEKMRGQIRGLSQASRNAQDGISLIQTAEGALNETHAILQRMRELAVQAANDTNVDADRTAIRSEVDQLTSEVNRIATDTRFNDRFLLDGSFGSSVNLAASNAGSVTGVASITSTGTPTGVYSITSSSAGNLTMANGGLTQTISNADGPQTLNFSLFGVTINTAAGYVADSLAGNQVTMSGSNATLLIGANAAEEMLINISDMRASALGIGTVTVGDHAQAEASISLINLAITRVSAQRSNLGAFQNRLDHTINNLGTSAENLTAAESRIRDVDMAQEMMEFTKNNILSQAAQAMLAQANQLPQGVLQLLR